MGTVGIFLASLAAVAMATSVLPSMRTRVSGAISRLAARGLHATARELPKFALIRIGLGVVVTLRGWAILDHLAAVDVARSEVFLVVLANLLAGLLVACGLLTQFALLYLVVYQWQAGDALLGTATLGNDVGAILGVLLIVCNAGRRLSLDAVLMARTATPWLRRCLLYYAWPPSSQTMVVAKAMALYSYWLVCVYSLCMHVAEPAWMSGDAGPLLLTNNFMSAWSLQFAEWFAASPAAVLAAKVALWLMFPWYLLALPFVLLGGWYRRYVIGWGLLFFLLSWRVLQLGWLAEIEFLLWGALFWSRAGIQAGGTLEVAYDDGCNLCDRTVKVVRALDVFERVRLVPVSTNGDWLARRGVSVERAMEDLHGFDTGTGTLAWGYGFYEALARHLVLLWPAYPLLLLGRWLRIGPLVYRWVALRRRRMFGVCTLPSRKRAVPPLGPDDADPVQQAVVATVATHMLVLGLGYLVAIPTPYLPVPHFPNRIADAAHVYGIAPINVFNETDLRMAENWFTLREMEGDAAGGLLPILSEGGSRLAYHVSDRIYFGNTLVYRRRHIGEAGCFLDQERFRMGYLARVHDWKSDRSGISSSVLYTQYFQPLPDAALLAKNRYVRTAPEVRCEAILHY